MPSRARPCRCGTPAPPSVSVASEAAPVWSAIIECPACGLVASASGPDALDALHDAMVQWNALSFARRLYIVPPPGRRRRGGNGR